MRPFSTLASLVVLVLTTSVHAQNVGRVEPGEQSNFDPSSGTAMKCYVVTRDDIRYGEQPGTDPATGRECRPVTAEVIERLRAYKWGNRPRKIETTDPTFFSLKTGEPIVWYHKAQTGEIDLYDLMGFDPETGDELLPITREVVAVWRGQDKVRRDEERQRRQEEARQVPQPVDLDKYDPFDPRSGQPRVWYSQTDQGEYQFYDAPGYNPRTGDPLKIITREVLEAWHNSLMRPTAQECYIITQDPREPVQYRRQVGTDPVTGRQCRPVTPEIVERLRAYEQGKRPARITAADPTFFDPRTGEPIVWYLLNKREEIELFDLMGFHPETGVELMPVDKETVELWKEQSRRRPPKRIDPYTSEIFDPLTGAGRVWYLRTAEGEYEFFDNPGYHPRTGEALTRLTKELAVTIFKEMQERQKKLDEENRKREQEARKHAERQEQERQDRLREEQKKQEERERRRERETRAAVVCDQLAANPSDVNRVGDGVPFDLLKQHAREAVENCELAASQSPKELRFQYQLARALEFSDRERAFGIHKKLTQARYPAAFDNAGWLYINERKNFAQAVAHFRDGAQLGDSDAMMSLVEMYDRGRATPRTANESKIALLKRAAQLNHNGAAKYLEQEAEKTRRLEQQRAYEQEQARRMMELFGAVIHGVQRRSF